MPDQDAEVNNELVEIKQWLSKQPHLPQDIEDVLLRRFYMSCGKKMERIKRTIDLFFTIRASAPDLFCKRDPWSPEIRRVFEITDMLPLPNKTKENYKVFIYRLNNPDLDLFNFTDAVKTFFMLADTRLTEEDEIPSGEIPIFDSANVSLKFIAKVNLSVLRKYMMYTQGTARTTRSMKAQETVRVDITSKVQYRRHLENKAKLASKKLDVLNEAIPIRLKQVHVINAPSYISKIYALCKPFLKSEVAKLIKFHEPNSDTLYKDVPQELLPVEYGGKSGSIDQIKRYWIKRIEAKRNWFLANDDNWKVNEALRPSGCQDDRTSKVQELPGTFRSLALD